MNFERLTPVEFPYECEPCEVRGFGDGICWLCGEEARKISKLILPTLHAGGEVADVINE